MKIKLNEEIIEYCKILKLKGIRTHFEEVMKEATDYEDFLHKLLTYEMEEKDKRSIDCRIRNAHLPYRQYFEDIEMEKIKFCPLNAAYHRISYQLLILCGPA
jgi:DNA replication protein DnaC